MVENSTLATELLHELKASAKRWFIIAIIELAIIFAIVGSFIWYLTLPVEETVIEQDATDRSFNIINGWEINGGASEDNVQETW